MSNSLRPHGLQPSRFLCPREISRQEHWSGLPCPLSGGCPNPGIEPGLSCTAGGFFAVWATREAWLPTIQDEDIAIVFYLASYKIHSFLVPLSFLSGQIKMWSNVVFILLLYSWIMCYTIITFFWQNNLFFKFPLCLSLTYTASQLCKFLSCPVSSNHVRYCQFHFLEELPGFSGLFNLHLFFSKHAAQLYYGSLPVTTSLTFFSLPLVWFLFFFPFPLFQLNTFFRNFLIKNVRETEYFRLRHHFPTLRLNWELTGFKF